MDTSILIEFINPALLIMIVFIYCIGLFLKKLKGFKDWLIPLTLLVIAIVFTILYIAFVVGEGLTIVVIINGVIQGTICASVAVFGDNVIKQITVKRG